MEFHRKDSWRKSILDTINYFANWLAKTKQNPSDKVESIFKPTSSIFPSSVIHSSFNINNDINNEDEVILVQNDSSEEEEKDPIFTMNQQQQQQQQQQKDPQAQLAAALQQLANTLAAQQ